LLFRTVLQPFTIMTALPLSVGGALLALLLTHSSLSLPAMIGSLMLMGIVGKNGILLVDFIIEQRKRSGVSRTEAIIVACQQRAQPILMTTLAMIAGMVPVILGLGAGTAFRAPMAIAVIGGLVTSTALSLLFVPVVYTFVDDFEAWVTPKLRKLTTLK
jgi:HAE1 family hydrophobic/amphiphilic exporter-1